MGDGTVIGPMIEAAGLAKHYGQTLALAGVDFAVPAGTILGLLGPNGAGKTRGGADPDHAGPSPTPAGPPWRGSTW